MYSVGEIPVTAMHVVSKITFHFTVNTNIYKQNFNKINFRQISMFVITGKLLISLLTV